jgi:predicted amidohydrolase YtcJ
MKSKIIQQYLYNGTFWAGNNVKPISGWIEISNSKISQIEEGELPDRYLGKSSINLNKAHILPGLVDCHSHLSVSAWIPFTIDGSAWTTKKSLLASISKNSTNLDKESWLIAFHADFYKMDQLPTLDELNSASGGRPIVISDYSLHLYLVNEAAVKISGICDFKYPSGEIEYKKGKLTGLIKESAGGYMLGMALTKFSEHFEGLNVYTMLEMEAERHLSLGITGCHDPSVHPRIQFAMEKLEKKSPLKLSWSHVKAHEDPEFIPDELCLSCGTGPRSAKIFLDGASQCSLCLDPMQIMKMSAYSIGTALKGDFKGLKSLTRTKLNYKNGLFFSPHSRMNKTQASQILSDLGSEGLRPKIHALGNEAVNCACTALKESKTKDATIEHLVFLTDENIENVASTGAIASLQPGFLENTSEIRDSNIEKVFHVIPAKSLMKAGVPTALSSDNPCGPLNPLENIRRAVNRNTSSGYIFDKKESLTMSEAIRAYSIVGNQAIHGREGKGLELGAEADMTILNGHPENNFSEVISTWIDGVEVYSR